MRDDEQGHFVRLLARALRPERIGEDAFIIQKVVSSTAFDLNGMHGSALRGRDRHYFLRLEYASSVNVFAPS